MDEVAGSVQKSLVTISEIPRDLLHPLAIGEGKDPSDLDPSRLEVYDEENEVPDQARPRDHFDAEEIRCSNCTPVSLKERLPGHSLFSDRVKPVIEKDPLDCVSCDLVSEIVKRSSNSDIAPARVVAGHQKNQFLYVDCGPRTIWSPILVAIIFLGDQLSVPPKQTIWRHQGPDFGKPFSPNGLDREPGKLSI